MTVMIFGMLLVTLFGSEMRAVKSNVAVFKFRFGKTSLAIEQIRVEKAYFFKDCVVKCIKRVSSNESLA